MKRFILLLLFIATNATAIAQNGFDYHQFSIGAGLGSTIAYGNTDTKVTKAAFNFNVNYNATPFFTYTLETQFGQLAGGSPYDYYQRQFTNTYFAMMAHADLQLGELIDYEYNDVSNALKNIYVGTGVGFMTNSITYIQLTIPPGLSGNGSNVYPFLPSSVNVVVPLRLGYEFKLYNYYDMPRYRVDFGYSFNTAFGKGLDGYTSLSSIKFYNYLSVTFKVGLGTVTNYRKPVPYYGY
ncbi:hypothetical protein BEL04_20600 [Mucilaginibacter sp. PPCGB 2223]|uniref:hypothetical protein n=1 Tax=Mucilaginibacter sp. PPCGB 2223 TaxID=1886027 RepID=UPI000826E9F4|nr:hypothetical protein [Mucilaginibacter sp. PPCGB 2223]OCX51114.1 hypothetical protein BEL04_20600 [Mucilaginibacter sp. PPCGB 2223]